MSVQVQLALAPTTASSAWMTPTVGSSEGSLIRHITSSMESLEQPIRGKRWRRTTIEMLSEDTLLDVFDFYRLDAMKQSLERPWKWHRLAHVCRRWRCVMTLSPRRLGLQILCGSGAPIESILDSWPTLPLVVRYKGPESQSLPNNIIVALRRTDRVCAIDLILTSPITGGSIARRFRSHFMHWSAFK
ncbi:hypothetical protein BJV77DRAFT_217164 [Russula vinacea]|nr:hypothetical protein BJV77DRAFT_217164 [Russula vinacea]